MMVDMYGDVMHGEHDNVELGENYPSGEAGNILLHK